ncbi:hypothetical protein ES703_102591 [subsurface metagenome]
MSRNDKGIIFDAVLLAIEPLCFLFFLTFFFWSWRTLGLPALPVLEFWQDLHGPMNIKIRLAYGTIGIIYGLISWLLGPLPERALFMVLAWLRRPFGAGAGICYEAMLERMESVPLFHIPPHQIFGWYRQFNYVLLGSRIPVSWLPSPVDLAFASVLHFAITALFLPEILRGLFGAGWLGPIMGIAFIYFLIRWFMIFWSYFLLVDARIRAFRKKTYGEERPVPARISGVFVFFGSVYGILYFIM